MGNAVHVTPEMMHAFAVNRAAATPAWRRDGRRMRSLDLAIAYAPLVAFRLSDADPGFFYARCCVRRDGATGGVTFHDRMDEEAGVGIAWVKLKRAPAGFLAAERAAHPHRPERETVAAALGLWLYELAPHGRSLSDRVAEAIEACRLSVREQADRDRQARREARRQAESSASLGM